MPSKNVVTRFAPSPTGRMHLGNLRTALYAYLTAKSAGGVFILRIEDTDKKRQTEGAVETIMRTLESAGLIWDEGPVKGGTHGPYIQSERLGVYAAHAKILLEKGAAYRCFCGGEGEEECRCRSLEGALSDSRALTEPFAVRQAIPAQGTTTWTDAVYGTITVSNSELEDQVLLKSDGFPTYNFAHVVDDHLMEVTHVLRGSEYVTSTPKYALLYDAFGWERPTYIHLPLIMGRDADGAVSKLSKRHGAVSFEDLTEAGYLPEAIVNYIALLGWSPKGTNEEIFTLEELASVFDCSGVSKSPAVFDYLKLLWVNGEYIRKQGGQEFFMAAAPWILKAAPNAADPGLIARLVQPRITLYSQIEALCAFLGELPEYGAELFDNKKAGASRPFALTVLERVLSEEKGVKEYTGNALYEWIQATAGALGVKIGAVAWVLRIAVSGQASTPGGATELMEALGERECRRRFTLALEKLADGPA